MKVKNETECPVLDGRCDFCGWYEPKYSVNGGAWWICVSCMNEHYGGDDRVKKCQGISAACTPDDCKCGEEE
jgi:hypothetical protein